MEFRIANAFTDSLARLTGEEQKAKMGQNRFEQSNVSDPFGCSAIAVRRLPGPEGLIESWLVL
ncbi:MAG: hypothetical protein Q8J99_06155 [Sulfuritalea sp.]|nr:hypothetical protein [Sulfuritalea sp.]